MKKKWTPHIIAINALIVFIVLGLACASEPKYKEISPDKLKSYVNTPNPIVKRFLTTETRLSLEKDGYNSRVVLLDVDYIEASIASLLREEKFLEERIEDNKVYKVYLIMDGNFIYVARIDGLTPLVDGRPKRKYDLVDGNLVIHDGVTKIRFSEFADKNLTSVTIPDSVTYIDGSAFARNKLTSVTIPNSVTYIGGFAFYNNQLTSVTISNSITSISENAFVNNKLTSVTIPNSVTSIGSQAFANNQLTSVVIGNSVTSIDGWAFRYNQLTSVTIPNSVTKIGDYAFANNQLTSVSVPDNVTLGKGVFEGNSKLANAPMLPSEKEAAQKKAEEEQKKQVEQTRLAGLYRQAGNNIGNLRNTSKRNRQPTFIGYLTTIYDFGDGEYIVEKLLDDGSTWSKTTGTFRVNGNSVIFLSSGGEYNIGTIIGNTLNINGDVYR